MSLLLEALKKAEKAKEEAQRRARSEGGEPELGLEAGAAAAPQPEARPVLTRDNLPEITSQPLEILADEPPPRPAPPPPPRQKPEPAKAETAAAAERASARKVFEAKFKEPNPRLAFYITMGVLGAFAVGTVGYFWVQLRPPPSLVNSNPAPPAGERPVEIAALPKPAALAPATTAPAAIPGLPGTTPVQPAASTAQQQTSTAQQQPRSAPPPAELRPKPPVVRPRPEPAPETPRLAAPGPRLETRPEPRAQAARPVDHVHPGVESGYAAYLAGDFVTARAEYEQALREEPANRDAQFGLAALHVKAGRYEIGRAHV